MVLIGLGLSRGTSDAATPSNVQVLTYHNDAARTGQNLQEKLLNSMTVNPARFGRVGFFPTDGLVDAEPLYVSNLLLAGEAHNVVFVATEHDSVYAFDADTLATLWQTTVLPANETPSDKRNCEQVSPEIGITSTPVISFDGDAGVLYLVAMSKDGEGNYFQRLHALDISTGAEISGSPATIQAEFPNLQGTTVFDPQQYKDRAALLLQDGIIYTTWASHCDEGPYTGWVIAYDAATLQRTAVLNVTPNGTDGAIWMSGSGPAGDGLGNVYVLDGNGTFDAALDSAGFPVHGDFGNAFLKFTYRQHKLAVADYFSAHNTQNESSRDADLGSGGVVLLPNLQDAAGNTVQLALGAGKTNTIYVVNRNAMGRFNPKNDRAVYQKLEHALIGPVFATPAYFNNTVFFAAVNDALKAFPIVDAKLAAEPTSHSAARFAYPGATPSISANGNADAIVWAVEARGSDAGALHAYDAYDLTHELYNSAKTNGRDAFSDNKFITPMVANGRVFVGTLTGVAVFGLLK